MTEPSGERLQEGSFDLAQLARTQTQHTKKTKTENKQRSAFLEKKLKKYNFKRSKFTGGIPPLYQSMAGYFNTEKVI